MKKNKLIQLTAVTALALAAACFTGCETMNHKLKSSITKADFGKTPDGQAVEIYTLRNSHGMEATIMTYGGIVTSLKTPDKSGQFGDVVLGYDNLDGYIKSTPYFGALIGRYGNRIALGKFSLDGQTYTLATNNMPNALHGGLKGFDKVVWRVEDADVEENGPELELVYVSKDGEEGYPGNLTVHVTYTVMEDNALQVKFSATTDKKTVLNLTQHSYFNLRGSGDILDHSVTINGDKFTPVDSTLIPTGELRPVVGTPFDFTSPHKIGERIGMTNDEQIKFGGGYDHNWVLNKSDDKLSLAATVSEATSGRVMEVWSTSPGVQFYSGNFLDGTLTGKGGWTYQFRNGLCFEPQHFPDSPNHPAFPTTELKPGETYHNTIIYKFSAK